MLLADDANRQPAITVDYIEYDELNENTSLHHDVFRSFLII